MAAVQNDSLPVTPAVVAWARDRAGYSQEEATKYFKKIAAWESGDAAPTYAQLEQMADKFKVPVAVFFFPEPPDVEQAKNSFRTLTDHDFEQIPRPVRALLRKGQAMQINLEELNEGKNPSERLITRDLQFSTDAALDDMAVAVREYLGVSLKQQWAWASAEVALEQWRDAFARAGVFVFKDAFHVQGYFGFCLYSDEFPVIVANNSSAKTRQIFTLFHELAHLLFHTSGIDQQDDSFILHLPEIERRVEVICNEFAGRFLVPDAVFDQQLKRLAPTREAAADLAKLYSVSREVIYRKMLDRGLIAEDEYQDAASVWAKQKKPEKPGGNYYFTQFAYLGSHYINLALARYYQRQFDDVRLAEYLNIKPRSLPAFEQLYEGRS